ncbi:hypothetical protein MUK42_29026 [Musa troglodytarum]|uniref:Secreted protein n=1 Tax=Musa troglodytarum TaxID=320322 RepID=A0A9E7K093_9LILI|nr:hypothetical protein MUK42_29026 [Musa troglodytarum]
MGCHQSTLFAVISVLCMLISPPATVQSVSRDAPHSLIVNGVEVIHPNRSPSGCTIANGKKVRRMKLMFAITSPPGDAIYSSKDARMTKGVTVRSGAPLPFGSRCTSRMKVRRSLAVKFDREIQYGPLSCMITPSGAKVCNPQDPVYQPLKPRPPHTLPLRQ